MKVNKPYSNEIVQQYYTTSTELSDRKEFQKLKLAEVNWKSDDRMKKKKLQKTEITAISTS